MDSEKIRFCYRDNFTKGYICNICHKYMEIDIEDEIYECIRCKYTIIREAYKIWHRILDYCCPKKTA